MAQCPYFDIRFWAIFGPTGMKILIGTQEGGSGLNPLLTSPLQ